MEKQILIEKVRNGGRNFSAKTDTARKDVHKMSEIFVIKSEFSATIFSNEFGGICINQQSRRNGRIQSSQWPNKCSTKASKGKGIFESFCYEIAINLKCFYGNY